MKALKVLVLKSSDNSISQIIKVLKNNDFYVDICNSNNEFLECIYNNLYDLYLININEKSLPKFQLIQLLNEYQDITMKMVIASIPDITKASFIYGCDECIFQSIDDKEILLRVKANDKFKANSLKSDFLTLIYNSLYKYEIEIPFPQLDLHMKK